MRKILFSLVMIAATVGIVASSAYALFSDKAQVQGVSITSGNAKLAVNTFGESSSWFTGKVYPGWLAGHVFGLTNNSDSDIAFNLAGQLTAGTNNWGSYKDKISVALVEYGTQAYAQKAVADNNIAYGATKNNGWVSLSDWYSSQHGFGAALNKGDTHFYVLWMTIDKNATSSDINGTISTNWEITGTQI